MAKYLLDSDICIAFLKGKLNLISKVEKAGIENCYVSEITIAELTYGAYYSDKFEKHINEVRKTQELFEVIPIHVCLELFGKEKARLRRAGNLIPDFDLIIATTAVQLDMILVSNNEKHLLRVEGIKLENWIKNDVA